MEVRFFSTRVRHGVKYWWVNILINVEFCRDFRKEARMWM